MHSLSVFAAKINKNTRKVRKFCLGTRAKACPLASLCTRIQHASNTMHATPLRSSPKHNAVTLPTSFRFWNVLSTANSCSFRTIKAAKTVAPVRTYSTAGACKFTPCTRTHAHILTHTSSHAHTYICTLFDSLNLVFFVGPRKRFTDEIIQSYTNNLRFTIIDNTVGMLVCIDMQREMLACSGG